MCKSIYILKVYSTHYTLKKTQIFLSFGQNKRYKKCRLFFFCARTSAHHSFTFNLRFLYELKHKVHLSKTVCGIFHFWFCFVFIKVYILVQQNAWTLWFYNIIAPFKVKIIEKPHTVLIPAVWFLSCNKFQNSKISACCELELPKTDLVTHFLHTENWSF